MMDIVIAGWKLRRLQKKQKTKLGKVSGDVGESGLEVGRRRERGLGDEIYV